MATPTERRIDALDVDLPALMADLRERQAAEKRRVDALIASIRDHFTGNDADHMAQRHYYLDAELDYTHRPSEATA